MTGFEIEPHKRVLIVEPLGDGGIAHYTYNLVWALLEAGHKPLLSTASRYEFSHKDWPPGSLRMSLFRLAFLLIRVFPSLDAEQGLKAVVRRFIKLVEYPFNALETVFLARWSGVRFVHIQTVNSIDLIVVVCARLFGLKVVTTVHNVNPLHGEMTGLHRRLLQWLYDLSHRLIIHTDAGKADIMELFGLAPEKISVIPHGDYSFFVKEQNSQLENPFRSDSNQDLLFFGAIRPNKGLDILLKAMPSILKSYPHCRLFVVGEPVGGFEPYAHLIQSKKLEGVVEKVLHYVGNEEVAGFFKSAAIAVLPYREITQSGVLQIAFAFGTPVVATSLPGFREVIEHGVNGVLVQPEDPVALSIACCDLLADPVRAREMGEVARERMAKEYSWDAIALRTEEEVYKVLA